MYARWCFVGQLHTAREPSVLYVNFRLIRFWLGPRVYEWAVFRGFLLRLIMCFGPVVLSAQIDIKVHLV